MCIVNYLFVGVGPVSGDLATGPKGTHRHSVYTQLQQGQHGAGLGSVLCSVYLPYSTY